ncbi:MAG: hypothetical protein HY231_11410 [Acidobacteria bacterium]|nr:hypothetical protein [Acidobacteriota bacterium]
MQADDFKREYQVVKDYSVYYTDAIVMQSDDKLTITEKESEWVGWVWCTNERHNKSGWVPEKYVERQGDKATALVDYDAKELAARVGEALTATLEMCGWVWCKNQQGESGWVPLDHLEQKG